MRKYTADFETSTPTWYEIDGYVRVWAFSICEIGNPENFIYGNSIDDFIKICMNKKSNDIYYFHNLKFDGEYIIYYLLTNGFTWIKDKKERRDKTFTTIIADTGQFYSIEVYFEVKKNRVNKVVFYDSLKILNFGVEFIAKKFNLPIQKLELDYDRYREVGYVLEQYEIDYIRNDVEIMARALDIMFNKGLNKMTIGADALNNYKKIIPSFDSYFPNLGSKDTLIRKSYRGGWTYLNPLYKEKIVDEVIVIDKNSMYPSMMYYEDMPFGEPIYYDGEYKKDICYPLYIQVLSCSFKIKDGKLPTIQLKNTLGYMDNEYIETTDGKIETLILTSVDLELFLNHYDVEDLVYQGGFKFKRIKGIFCKYIDTWIGEKNKAKKENNGAMYQISKLMLNSLYGKFGLNPECRSKSPVLRSDESIGYTVSPLEYRNSIYVPMASFITSYARRDIITNSQAIRDYTKNKYGKDFYIYSDTDSIHCLKLSEDELKQFMDLDDYKLGAYKVEHDDIVNAKFIRQKCYVEVDNKGNIMTTIAGLPKKLGKYITLDNFNPGFKIEANDEEYEEHKLRFCHVKGGVMLVNTDFTIKE